ncbi:hypothetical protein QAD02_024391 [Eretmocerus hayati]|uniref:Uncharacterized protein n=1 Tax=Eretmocerus hayati TaxID=131215 RepID=A0ACC2PYH1_9HYME|nr:hypothetical protein QAD02_024391 [Eretmocerus hayati]
MSVSKFDLGNDSLHGSRVVLAGIFPQCTSHHEERYVNASHCVEAGDWKNARVAQTERDRGKNGLYEIQRVSTVLVYGQGSESHAEDVTGAHRVLAVLAAAEKRVHEITQAGQQKVS